ncbi:MAG: hypothetical protein GXC73_19425 [Chitinophagaceae bacterium]|nr:hypothetical protein [Chitinophagaceae bacterium]
MLYKNNLFRHLSLFQKEKMHRLVILILLSFAISVSMAQSQSVTEKDFRILIDGKQYTDSVNSISLADLLKMQKISANFSWITVRSIVVYYQPPFGETAFQLCTADTICSDAKELIKRFKSGYLIAIAADEAVNRQEKKIYIKEVYFRIK